MVVVLYCGIPVEATFAGPEGAKIWSIRDEAARTATMDMARAIKEQGGRVELVKVEEQVEGLRCPTST